MRGARGARAGNGTAGFRDRSGGGLDVLDTMQKVPTGGGDKPKTDVVINSVAITVADD